MVLGAAITIGERGRINLPDPASSRPPRLHTHARRRTLQENIATETEQFCRAPAGVGANDARRFDKTSGFDETTEVLLVKMRSEDGFNRPLKLEQRELIRHQLEHHGPPLDLGADAADRSSQDAAVVVAHGKTKTRGEGSVCIFGNVAAIAARLAYETCLVQQFVALQDLLFVPLCAIEAEAHANTLCPQDRALRRGRRARTIGPGLKMRDDHLAQDGWLPVAKIFPWEIVIPTAPGAPQGSRVVDKSSECEVADGDNMRGCVVRQRVAAAIAVGVELLDIAEIKRSLLLDPSTQTALERPMLDGRERSER